MTENLDIWIENNLLDVVEALEGTPLLDTPLGFMYEIQPINNKHFNRNLKLTIYETDEDEWRHPYAQQVFEDVEKHDVKYFVYEFGGSFYYTPVGKSELNEFRYIGQSYQKVEIKSSFLGVHGRYERMNGSRDYKDWCLKAKFLGHQSLGICEKGTLAGVLQFQLACNKAGIQPIIGATIEVESDKGERYETKLYVKDEQGWLNLLNINKFITIENGGWIEQKELLKYTEGLVCVIAPDKHSPIDQLYDSFDDVYFQITTNEYKSDGKDREVLLTMKKYMDEYYPEIEPLIISDAYCLDFEDVHIKKKLNEAGKKFQATTENHYFRSNEEVFFELADLFSEDDQRLIKLFKRACKNSLNVAEMCQFQVDTKSLHLPEYEMTEDEMSHYSSKEEMFDEMVWTKAEQLIDEKGYDPDIIVERIEREMKVIKTGGFIDYFLILWDICVWCEQQNILTGVGRGSAGGSLVSYCLGIIKLNPLDYDLLFERFLNEGRIESELPDIDIDFNSERRDEVIQYIKDRYGEEFVCRVGTYTTLQVKGVIKELSKLVGAAEAKDLNRITKMIEDENNTKWKGIFIDAARKMQLKGFVTENSDVINDARLALNVIKSSSQHACATIVVPKVGKPARTIFEWFPMRKDDQGNLISEWEGDHLAKAGFLKEDILSTKQMAKINAIFDLIKQNHQEKLTLEGIPLDDNKVYALFCKGYNQDVFHFGSDKLTEYLKTVVPTNINDLIAAIALYRPGAMLAGAHEDFVKFKNGEAEPEYDYMLEEVTKDTYGLYVYQEQIMKACQVLAGFSLVEADGIRKAMGKKIKELMDSYKVKFIDGALANGCPEDQAHTIWDKLEMFAGYGFNKSHAAAYAITGYICNWLKVNYPMEFWTVAFDKANKDDLPAYVAEIGKLGDIEVVPVDINKSRTHFYADFKQKKIFWSFDKISMCGPAATEALMTVREENGKFFSLEEFYERIPKAVIKKPVVINLILSGAFDDVCMVSKVEDRLNVIKEYYELRGEDLPEEFTHKGVKTAVFWELMQKEKSKLGKISYIKALHQTHSDMRDYIPIYRDADQIFEECEEKEFVMVAGVVNEVKPRVDKFQRNYCDITINNNNRDILIRIFADIWQGEVGGFDGWRDQLEGSKGRILCITGIVSDWRNFRNIQTVTKQKKSKFEIF